MNLEERVKCSQMLQSVKLCSRTAMMISSVESLLRNMSEPYDKEYVRTLLCTEMIFVVKRAKLSNCMHT